MFIVIQRNRHFYNEFYVHIFVWIVLVWEYDEMKCNLVSGIFYNVFWNTNFAYMK
jgi:hypothetical protein